VDSVSKVYVILRRPDWRKALETCGRAATNWGGTSQAAQTAQIRAGTASIEAASKTSVSLQTID